MGADRFLCLFLVSFAVFFTFLVFFSVFGASCVAGASCANTGIASENATANVNKSVRSFFMLCLLRNHFLLGWEQGMGHFPVIAPDIGK